MKAKNQPDKSRLLETAKAIAAELKRRAEGTTLRIRSPSRVRCTNTGGWAARIGDLGKRRPGLDIWLDRFTRHDGRKLQACFAGNRRQLTTLTERVDKSLVPIRTITSDDTDDG